MVEKVHKGTAQYRTCHCDSGRRDLLSLRNQGHRVVIACLFSVPLSASFLVAHCRRPCLHCLDSVLLGLRSPRSSPTMPRRQRYYSLFTPPSLSMTELVRTTLDPDSTDMLIDKWLEHRSSGHDAYHEWFRDVRERKHAISHNKQVLVWNKGEFVPENIFCRTVDTGRLIPLDRTWTTHLYHHRSMQERKLSMMPVVFTMVRVSILCFQTHVSSRVCVIKLPELMLLRGMHDVGCEEIFIIVTDLKRQEMDDVTEYFKLVCRNTFGRTCKPSMERVIQYERQFPLSPPSSSVSEMRSFIRYAHMSHSRTAKTYSVLPPNRSHLPRNPLREETAISRIIFTPDDILLSNHIYSRFVRPRRRHLLRLPHRLPESLLHRGLRDDPVPSARAQGCVCP